MAHVIKRSGAHHGEPFDFDKLYSSIEAACLSVRSPDGEASTIAHHVSRSVHEWASAKPAVTSHDIRRVSTKLLETFHPEAAYLYQNHRLVV